MMTNLIAIAVGFSRTIYSSRPQWSRLLGGVFFSFWVLAHLYPFAKGLMGRRGRTPTIVFVWSGLIAITISLLWVAINPPAGATEIGGSFQFPWWIIPQAMSVNWVVLPTTSDYQETFISHWWTENTSRACEGSVLGRMCFLCNFFILFIWWPQIQIILLKYQLDGKHFIINLLVWEPNKSFRFRYIVSQFTTQQLSDI